ncbi:MAG: hypothetical protein IJW54_06160 [Clostridia bacterium]|nr:hypothetical protein [Clostridia bacterium]
MRYITPEYNIEAIDTEDIMTSVNQNENETNTQISFDDLMSSLNNALSNN